MKIDMTKLDKKVTLSEMIEMLGGQVADYPVMGRCVTFQGKRTPEHDIQDAGNVCISYEWSIPAEGGLGDEKLVRIYIGHKFSGPMLSCSQDDGGAWVWRNLYSNGGHGGNASCGGSWYANSRRTYPAASEALVDRDYNQAFGPNRPHQKAYTESGILLEEVKNFCGEF